MTVKMVINGVAQNRTASMAEWMQYVAHRFGATYYINVHGYVMNENKQAIEGLQFIR